MVDTAHTNAIKALTKEIALLNKIMKYNNALLINLNRNLQATAIKEEEPNAE